MASRHESNRLRIAPGEMPVHKDHQGKAPAAFVPRSHQLLPFVATPRQLGTWVLGFVMRIDAQRAGAEAAPSRGAGAPSFPAFCATWL